MKSLGRSLPVCQVVLIFTVRVFGTHLGFFGYRYQANALAELGIVCSLSSGRIVANPEVIRLIGTPDR
jgi:hypothetical protein